VSEQVPASEQARGATPGDVARPGADTDRLAGLATRATGDASDWGLRDAPATAPPPPHVVAEPSPLRPGASPTASASGAATSAAPAPVTIGRLSRVRGSDLWPDGAGLAGWLAASPEPLAETLGKPPFEFANSGSNILLGTSADQHPVCVVCEVGPSSDEGLGVLLRVAAVQEGGLVVWIAGEMVDSHVAALSWLNRTTAPRFYLVRVSGIRIDGSASAPIFELVARPPRGPAPTASAAADGAAARPNEVPRRRAEDHVPGA
jgi:hypothetical protein